jgi:5,10-methylenetetrahydromethanopterin reductase
MTLQMSCALATSPQSPEHIQLAEELGYNRAYLYDSPPLYPDVWMQLARAADRTSTIVLGAAGVIPSNRSVMTNAAAISSLVDIVGQDRVSVAFGTGMTSRLAMGLRPLRWAVVADYVRALRALLRGEVVEWEGHPIQMLHSEGFANLPIDVEVLMAVAGPKGEQAARDVADGVFGGMAPVPGFERSPCLAFGTVLQAGEDPGSQRVLEAAGHLAAVSAHWGIEFGGLEGQVKNGQAWLDSYQDVPDGQRHLAVHREHLVGMNVRDRNFVDGEMLLGLDLALSSEEWRQKLDALAAGGATEVAYQPAGDIAGELTRFAELWRD